MFYRKSTSPFRAPLASCLFITSRDNHQRLSERHWRKTDNREPFPEIQFIIYKPKLVAINVYAKGSILEWQKINIWKDTQFERGSAMHSQWLRSLLCGVVCLVDGEHHLTVARKAISKCVSLPSLTCVEQRQWIRMAILVSRPEDNWCTSWQTVKIMPSLWRVNMGT